MDKYLHEEYRLRTAHRALGFGLASLASACILFSAPFIAFGLGFFSILFACLSKGYKKTFDKDAKIGMALATVGIIISISVTGTAVHRLVSDKTFRNDVFTTLEQFYGSDYEEYYGESFPGSLEDLLGGGTDVDL